MPEIKPTLPKYEIFKAQIFPHTTSDSATYASVRRSTEKAKPLSF